MTTMTTTNTTMTLEQIPEELLDRILALSLSPDQSQPKTPRPSWHRSGHSTRLAPLLISRSLSRIATPHLYHTVNLADPAQTRLLLRTLRANPDLAAHVYALTLGGVWPAAGELMQLCAGAVRMLDIMLDLGESPDKDSVFCDGLGALTAVKELTVHKPTNVYLSMARPRHVLTALAGAIEGWSDLEMAKISFKLSDDTPTSPVLSGNTPVFASFSSGIPPARSSTLPAIPPSSPSTTTTNPGPITLLSTALARAPNLHTFITYLPSVWNLAILAVSENPALHRIVLLGGSAYQRPDSIYQAPAYNASAPHVAAASPSASASACPDAPSSSVPSRSPLSASAPKPAHTPVSAPRVPKIQTQGLVQAQGPVQTQGLIGSGLFLMEARRHPRLGALICAGNVDATHRAACMTPVLTSPVAMCAGGGGGGGGVMGPYPTPVSPCGGVGSRAGQAGFAHAYASGSNHPASGAGHGSRGRAYTMESPMTRARADSAVGSGLGVGVGVGVKGKGKFRA